MRGTAGSVENEDSPRQVEARSCLLSANGVLSLCRNRAEGRERRSFIDASTYRYFYKGVYFLERHEKLGILRDLFCKEN